MLIRFIGTLVNAEKKAKNFYSSQLFAKFYVFYSLFSHIARYPFKNNCILLITFKLHAREVLFWYFCCVTNISCESNIALLIVAVYNSERLML